MVREPFGSMTKTQAAFHRIRAEIEGGKPEPGERLRAVALQEDLGMSPTPIREALRLPQAQGLVEHRPHHGMVVAEYPAELNASWHRAVYEASGSRYLEEFIARLWGVLPLEAVWRSDRSISSVEEHERITAVVERRDVTRAVALMRRHIEDFSELATDLFQSESGVPIRRGSGCLTTSEALS